MLTNEDMTTGTVIRRASIGGSQLQACKAIGQDAPD